MKTLFIDSSKKSLSIAVVENDKLLFVSNVESHNKRSNFLLKEIINVLSNCDCTIYDIDNILVLNGPGSFTGIRVGVTIAKTLAWVLSKKIYTLSTLKAMYLSSRASDVNVSIIPDRNSNFYAGIYTSLNDEEEGYFDINYVVKSFNNKKITVTCFDLTDDVKKLCNKLEENNKVSIDVINDYDYVSIVKETLKKASINPHLVSALYLKKIDAEKTQNDN